MRVGAPGKDLNASHAGRLSAISQRLSDFESAVEHRDQSCSRCQDLQIADHGLARLCPAERESGGGAFNILLPLSKHLAAIPTYSLRTILSTRALQRLSIRAQTAFTMKFPSDYSSWAELISRTTDLLPGDYPSFESPNPSSIDFARFFDHTLLKTDATGPQVDELCKEARQHHFKVLYAAPSPLLTRLIIPPTDGVRAPGMGCSRRSKSEGLRRTRLLHRRLPRGHICDRR